MHKLRELILLLLAGDALPEGYKDHPLKGSWQGYRDAHIEPDWLLIYPSPATSSIWCARAPMPICSTNEPSAALRLIPIDRPR
jgi:hypothetical protein